MSDNKTVIVNKTAYGPVMGQKVLTMKVSFILDLVPGAYHQPEDLMHYIAQMSYVQSVSFDKDQMEDHKSVQELLNDAVKDMF